MRYMMFIKHSETYRNQAIPPALLEAMGKFVTAQMQKGTLVSTAGLKPSKDGYRIELRGGKLRQTDGPFTESKEIIGGYAIVEANPEEAHRIATEFMELHQKYWPGFDGVSEVRPMEEM